MENNAPSNYFIVQYNTSFNPDQWVSAKTVDSTQNTANIVLRSWANYTFRVIATNKIGQSFPSAHTKKVCTIYPDRPEKNPSNVRSIGSLRGYLVIEWTVSGIVNVIDYSKCSKILDTFYPPPPMTMAGALSVAPSVGTYLCPYVTPNNVCSLSRIVLIRIL